MISPLIKTLKPQYNEPLHNEFRDIVNKTQLPFWGFTQHITLDLYWIIRYSEQKGSDGLVRYIKVWVYLYQKAILFKIIDTLYYK